MTSSTSPTQPTADAKVELVKRLLNYDFGDESAHCIALAEAIGDLLPALEASHSLTEAITPVAWRYRYLHKGDGTDHWIVRQSPAYSSEPSQYSVGVEAEPLYTAAQAARPIAPETPGWFQDEEMRRHSEELSAPVQDDDARDLLLRRRADAVSQGGSCEITVEEIDELLGKQSLGDGR